MRFSLRFFRNSSRMFEGKNRRGPGVNVIKTFFLCHKLAIPPNQENLKGKYHCTIDLMFDWFGLACFANKNKNCQ